MKHLRSNDIRATAGDAGIAWMFGQHDTFVPPEFVGVCAESAIPFVKVNGDPAYEMTGALSFTVMEIEAVPVPPVLVAEMV